MTGYSDSKLLSVAHGGRVMNHDGKVTPKKQLHPEANRDMFLQGVMDQAQAEGYGTKDTGKLFVIALRAWEDR